MSPEPGELDCACCNCFAGFAALVRKVSDSLYAYHNSYPLLTDDGHLFCSTSSAMSDSTDSSDGLPIDPSLQRCAATSIQTYRYDLTIHVGRV